MVGAPAHARLDYFINGAPIQSNTRDLPANSRVTISAFDKNSAGSLAGYGLMGYCLALRWPGRPRRLALVVGLGLVVLLTGFSRIYLGRHYLSDVLAGFALGTAWLALCVLVLEVLRARLPA